MSYRYRLKKIIFEAGRTSVCISRRRRHVCRYAYTVRLPSSHADDVVVAVCYDTCIGPNVFVYNLIYVEEGGEGVWLVILF